MILNDIPLGFSMALAQNPQAMKAFANMSEDEQSKILSQLHKIESKEEMQAFVSNLK